MRDPFTRLVLGVLLALMIGWILVIGRPIILPLVAGILVAYILHGLAEMLDRVPGLPRGLTWPLSIALISAALFGIGWLVAVNLGEVVARAPAYQDRLLDAIHSISTQLGIETERNWDSLRRDLLGHVDLRRLAGLTAGSALSFLTSFLVIIIYAGFIATERVSFANKIAALSDDPANVARLTRVIRDINSRIGIYLGMKTLINIALALISYAVLRLYGIEFAAFWAVLIGLFNYIPYVGSWLGVGFPTLIAIVQFGAFWPVMSFIAAMSAVQILLGTFVEPILMGNSLNLSRTVILVSLVAWTAIWGIPGAILSVPLMAILVIIFSEFSATRPIAILLSLDGDLTPGRP